MCGQTLPVCAGNCRRAALRHGARCAAAARSWQLCLDLAAKGAAPGRKDLQVHECHRTPTHRAILLEPVLSAGRWIRRCPAYRASFCRPLLCAGPGVRCIVLYPHRCWLLETDAQVQKTRALGYFCRCCMQRGANATCTQVCVPFLALGALPECISPLNVVVWPCMLQSQGVIARPN